MRVAIEHKEKKSGLFKPVIQIEVATTIHFSEEEMTVIKKAQLYDLVIMERQPDRRTLGSMSADDRESFKDSWDLKVGSFVDGRPERFIVDTPAEARTYEHQLTSQLKELKAYLEANAELGEATTFEL